MSVAVYHSEVRRVAAELLRSHRRGSRPHQQGNEDEQRESECGATRHQGHKETSQLPAASLVRAAAQLLRLAGLVQLPCHVDIGESCGHARRPIAKRGRYRRKAVDAEGDSGLPRPRRRGPQRGRTGLGGRRDSAGPLKRRNFGNEMGAAESLRAFRPEHVPRSSPGNGNSTATGLSEGFMPIWCLNGRRNP